MDPGALDPGAVLLGPVNLVLCLLVGGGLVPPSAPWVALFLGMALAVVDEAPRWSTWILAVGLVGTLLAWWR